MMVVFQSLHCSELAVLFIFVIGKPQFRLYLKLNCNSILIMIDFFAHYILVLLNLISSKSNQTLED